MSIEERDFKHIKILKVAKCFLENPNITIQEVANLTGIPRSSVQRYLNSDVINSLCELREKYSNPKFVISERLKENKNEGNVKGGINFSMNNAPIKTEDGKFMGSRRK